jgi:hypothetical protein
MEPHRTLIVRLHHPELARQAVSDKVIVQLIAATSTDKGLTVTCGIDRSRYPFGIKSSKPNWPQSKSSVTLSTASGTTPSNQTNNRIDAIISRQTL